MNKLILLILASALAFATPAPGPLLPMGGGYSDIYAGFSQAAVANAQNGMVNILVLATPYSTNAIQITEAERATNLKDANERRFQIEEACKRAASPDVTCKAILAPIFTRSDAEDPATLNLLSDDLGAVFILGGDQTVGMQVIIGTPVEKRLEELNAQGVIFGGTSAGGGMQSRAMLAGYNPNYAAENSLSFGAADVWNTPEKHGLTFGLQNAILDQHFYQRARFGRLLNAILLPGVPHMGVGVDAYTGVVSEKEVLRGAFGLYTVTVLDAETYHAADGVQYIPLENTPERPPLLSARNILVSLLSPGDAEYDLNTRIAKIAGKDYLPPARLERQFDGLSTPQGAGALILAGDISDDLTDKNPALAAFASHSGGADGHWVIIAAGYSSDRTAQGVIESYQSAFAPKRVTSIIIPAGGNTLPEIPADVTGIILVARDASKLDPAAFSTVKTAWLAGVPLLADNAAAALMGSYFSAHRPTPGDAEEAELATQKSFWQGKTDIRPGLGLVDITIEPQMLADNRFGRLFSLAYNHPDLLAIGLNQNTAIEFADGNTKVLGDNSIFVLDLRTAGLGLGSNNGFVIANGFLDLFAPGERLTAQLADAEANFQPLPTPIVAMTSPTSSPTPEPSPTSTPESATKSTNTPLPESTVPAVEDEFSTSGTLAAIVLLIFVLLAASIFVILRSRRTAKGG